MHCNPTYDGRYQEKAEVGPHVRGVMGQFLFLSDDMSKSFVSKTWQHVLAGSLLYQSSKTLRSVQHQHHKPTIQIK